MIDLIISVLIFFVILLFAHLCGVDGASHGDTIEF